MDKLFERHDQYLSTTPASFVRGMMDTIDWTLPLILIKGPKGVGKSTLMLQYIKTHFAPDDRHVLYCSADMGYFSSHSLVDLADRFCKLGGTHLFVDEIHKYPCWSRELKEIYDLHRELHVVTSGSSLLQLNDGNADLSRRMIHYVMPGLSYREYIWFETGQMLPAISLDHLLAMPNDFCTQIKKNVKPLELFAAYLQHGYYPYYFENRHIYQSRVEQVVNYIIDVELTQYRNLEVGNTHKIRRLLQLVAQMVPYEVEITKLSKDTGLQRATLLRYLKYLDEASILRRLTTDINTFGDLQKPDKILLDNSNLLHVLSETTPQIGTARETFFCNQLAAAGHRVEYGGLKEGDFRIDGNIIVEVGGADEGFRQVKDSDNAFVAADGIDSATFRKIPLWAFGFLY